MKLRELRRFSVESVRDCRKTAWFMAFSYPIVWLILRGISDAVAGALIFQTETTPKEVLYSQNIFWALFSLLWNLITFCILMPMLCSICAWFSGKLGFSRSREFYAHGKQYWKCLWFFGQVEIIRFFMLFPCMLSFWLMTKFFWKASLMEEAGIWLFLTIQCFVLGIWTGVFYIRFCVSLSAVPLLFLEYPEMPAIRAVITSRKILEKRHRKLFQIVLTGWTLPNIINMLILFIQIRMKEYFQEKEFA